MLFCSQFVVKEEIFNSNNWNGEDTTFTPPKSQHSRQRVAVMDFFCNHLHIWFDCSFAHSSSGTRKRTLWFCVFVPVIVSCVLFKWAGQRGCPTTNSQSSLLLILWLTPNWKCSYKTKKKSAKQHPIFKIIPVKISLKSAATKPHKNGLRNQQPQQQHVLLRPLLILSQLHLFVAHLAAGRCFAAFFSHRQPRPTFLGAAAAHGGGAEQRELHCATGRREPIQSGLLPRPRHLWTSLMCPQVAEEAIRWSNRSRTNVNTKRQKDDLQRKEMLTRTIDTLNFNKYFPVVLFFVPMYKFPILQ